MTILQGMYMHINKTVIYDQAEDIYIFCTLSECHMIKLVLNFLYSLCVPHTVSMCVCCVRYTHA